MEQDLCRERSSYELKGEPTLNGSVSIDFHQDLLPRESIAPPFNPKLESLGIRKKNPPTPSRTLSKQTYASIILKLHHIKNALETPTVTNALLNNAALRGPHLCDLNQYPTHVHAVVSTSRESKMHKLTHTNKGPQVPLVFPQNSLYNSGKCNVVGGVEGTGGAGTSSHHIKHESMKLKPGLVMEKPLIGTSAPCGSWQRPRVSGGDRALSSMYGATLSTSDIPRIPCRSPPQHITKSALYLRVAVVDLKVGR